MNSSHLWSENDGLSRTYCLKLYGLSEPAVFFTTISGESKLHDDLITMGEQDTMKMSLKLK